MRITPLRRLSSPLAAAAAIGALVLVTGAAVLLQRPAGSGEAPPFEPRTGPDAPTDWFYRQRADAEGFIDYEARAEAIEQTRRMRAELGARNKTAAALAPWAGRGPINVGGRVTDIVADPADPTTVYVGSASGGIHKSTDNGATWTPVFDGVGSLSIGALAMHPTNPNVIWAGTGEANPGGGSVAYGGDGVYKTNDGGETWFKQGLTETRYIGRIVIDPSDPQRVYVAATGTLFSKNNDRGVYRTTNGGATWEQVLFVSDSTGAVDLAIDPSNPSRVFATMWERIRYPDTHDYGGVTSGLYRSEDGGDTWNQLTSGLPPSSGSPGRIGVAVAPSNPSTVYAIFCDETGFFDGFFRSLDSGDTWTQRNGPSGTFYSSYGWWFGRLWVDPLDANEVWADGVLLYRTLNGGSSWSNVTGPLHADQHAQWFQPANPNNMWKGNDGGVYRSSNGGGSWTHIETLANNQFYSNEVHPLQPNKIYGGMQDNGTWRTLGSTTWADDLFGGDGFQVAINPFGTNTHYLEYQYGEAYRTINDGGAYTYVKPSGVIRANWNTPIVMDPTSIGPIVYYGGSRLFRGVSPSSQGGWSAISPDLSDGNSGSNGVVYGTITTIAVAPSDAATIYVGTDDGNVWVTTNTGGSWTQVDAAIPDRWVTRVAVDPNDDAIGYATLSGFRRDDPLAHVFRTTNWGSSWSDISGNLPDAPVNDIIVDATNPSLLYLATDVGVFYSPNLGAAWAPLGMGLPDGIVVSDLDFVGGASPTLYAATFGRSMFSFDLTEIQAATDVRPPSGDDIAADPSASGASAFSLAQNAPNPVRAATRIGFALPRAMAARIEVVDPSGRRIATLADGVYPPGAHEVRWDGRDERGRAVASGHYLYRLEADGRVLTRKMLISR